MELGKKPLKTIQQTKLRVEAMLLFYAPSFLRLKCVCSCDEHIFLQMPLFKMSKGTKNFSDEIDKNYELKREIYERVHSCLRNIYFVLLSKIYIMLFSSHEIFIFFNIPNVYTT